MLLLCLMGDMGSLRELFLLGSFGGFVLTLKEKNYFECSNNILVIPSHFDKKKKKIQILFFKFTNFI